MEDVARAAQVSLVTVSRAVNTPDKLARATLARVRAAMERLHYVPNLTAGALASNRTRIVAAIVPTISNSIFSETIDGLGSALAADGYQLLLGQTQYREDEEARLVEAFIGRRVDGLVLTGIRHAAGVRARLTRAALPVVETWDLAKRPIDMAVGFSNFAAGKAAADFLCGKGYGRLAFVGGSDDRSLARQAGFREGAAARRAAYVAIESVGSPSSLSEGSAAVARLLARPRPPRAAFFVNDMLAAGAIFECQRRGVRVPEDLAVMGFADLPIAASMVPTLTTVQVRSLAMGQQAAALLVARLAGAPAPVKIVDSGFAVVERASA